MRIINKTEYEIIKKLVKRVFTECGVTPQGSVVINDFDLDRVYMDINGVDYVIRTWNIYETKTEKSIVFEWSLFYVEGERSIRLGGGINRFKV